MRIIRVRSPRLTSRASWSGRDVTWAVLGFAALMLLGAALGSSLVPANPPAAPVAAQGGFREGSIVFIPSAGNLCRQQVIDNDTGRIGNVRLVPCVQGDSARQVEAFRDGFQRK